MPCRHPKRVVIVEILNLKLNMAYGILEDTLAWYQITTLYHCCPNIGTIQYVYGFGTIPKTKEMLTMLILHDLQARMYDFFGFGTTKMYIEGNPIKLRVHSLLFKKVDGHVNLMWKEFMRDKDWLPSDNKGWRVFHDEGMDFTKLSVFPTKPIAAYTQVKEFLRVSSL